MEPLSDTSLGAAVAAAAYACVAAALVCGAAALVASRSVSAALPVFLDLLLAAGLLRLGLAGTWSAIGAAAAVVVLRKLAVAGLTGSLVPPSRRPKLNWQFTSHRDPEEPA